MRNIYPIENPQLRLWVSKAPREIDAWRPLRTFPYILILQCR